MKNVFVYMGEHRRTNTPLQTKQQTAAHLHQFMLLIQFRIKFNEFPNLVTLNAY